MLRWWLEVGRGRVADAAFCLVSCTAGGCAPRSYLDSYQLMQPCRPFSNAHSALQSQPLLLDPFLPFSLRTARPARLAATQHRPGTATLMEAPEAGRYGAPAHVWTPAGPRSR